MKKGIIVAIMLLTIILLVGCGKGEKVTGKVVIESSFKPTSITTFKETGESICENEEGLPIIRLFATSWCPHCQWVKETYNSVVKEYVEQGKIEAYHWVMDMDIDDLSGKKGIPESEQAIFKYYNEKGSIPTFVMGCKYMRIGNGYETQNNLAAEEEEFRLVIEDLINNEKNKNQ